MERRDVPNEISTWRIVATLLLYGLAKDLKNQLDKEMGIPTQKSKSGTSDSAK